MGENVITLLSTVLGAVVGLGSVLLADAIRRRHERAAQGQAERRAVYVAYLTSLHQANQDLRAVSLGELTGPALELAARTALREAAVVQAREHLALTAPEPVVRTADAAFRALRCLRDRVGEGKTLGDPAYAADLATYDGALHALRNAVRVDLGAQPLAAPLPR
ncbi:hypothetical protein [Streptomyces sp. NBC_01304]|uniref:hypothetical protein n=1 Tax=Streptomyces sp. NBC_01304 TaxID=2903818 RepID=UPI002E0EF84B|nr:hypothetical protein OG430_36205 [Streptomyces sp. NBC_01304]